VYELFWSRFPTTTRCAVISGDRSPNLAQAAQPRLATMTDREDSVQTCGPGSGYLLTTAGNPVPGI
jgi:hypothetical protein